MRSCWAELFIKSAQLEQILVVWLESLWCICFRGLWLFQFHFVDHFLNEKWLVPPEWSSLGSLAFHYLLLYLPCEHNHLDTDVIYSNVRQFVSVMKPKPNCGCSRRQNIVELRFWCWYLTDVIDGDIFWFLYLHEDWRL